MILLALFACKGGPEGGCAESDSPTLAIGTGETAYEAVSSGDTLELIRGPQGGVHLTLGVEATGFDTSEDLLGSISGLIDGVEVGVGSPFVSLRCNNQTSTQQAWDFRLIYDDDPANLDGRTTEITFSLIDVDGRTAQATTSVVIDATL